LNLWTLERSAYSDLVQRALHEDVGTGDITTSATVPADARGEGRLIAKAPLVLAGLPVTISVFHALDSGIDVRVQRDDGAELQPGDCIAVIAGPAAALLTGERVALNFLQRLSGIATLTRNFVRAAAGRITVLDTRKTMPTFRALERYAVRVGGGTNHRFGLFDAFLIKDNHIRISGGVAQAVARARAARSDLRVEVEAQSLEQVDEALAARVDVLLVDNLPLEDIREAVRRSRGRAKVEISGGVTLERLPELAATGADYVSVGALTHSAPAADISFEVELA
jgi:nicotinate-nucleotide pyrophosphorylase (carboxylating)